MVPFCSEPFATPSFARMTLDGGKQVILLSITRTPVRKPENQTVDLPDLFAIAALLGKFASHYDNTVEQAVRFSRAVAKRKNRRKNRKPINSSLMVEFVGVLFFVVTLHFNKMLPIKWYNNCPFQSIAKCLALMINPGK